MTVTATSVSVDVGVVVIGRNEGERLRRCLGSLSTLSCPVIYVDSGSTDNSVVWAKSQGVVVLALDMGIPFTAARARNAGFKYLQDNFPNISLIQFVDGDCEININWIVTAATFLSVRLDIVCVCGRLRERFPKRSLYNQLCDTEWNRLAGAVDSCGGIAMMRIDAFERAGRFNETLIAGEEPELCVRMRAQGGQIWRLPAEMALHDADMLRFSQWWRRAMRGGYAAAEGVAMYGATPSTRYALKLSKIIFWSTALPISIVALAAVDPWGIALVASYPVQIVRLSRQRVGDDRHGWLGASFQLLASFSEGAGVVKYLLDRIRRRPSRLLEYR